MTKSEELGKLMHQLVDASFDCGAHGPESTEKYEDVWRKCLRAEVELRDFVEPYLPKD